MTAGRGGELFHGRTLAWLLGLAGASLILGFVINIFSTDLFTETSAGNDTYSRSAVGHRALLELLQHYDVPVRVTRHAGVRPVRDQAVLLLEPPVRVGSGGKLDERLERLLERHSLVVVALPKWNYLAWPGAEEVEGVQKFSESRVARVLDALGHNGDTLTRPTGSLQDWQVRDRELDLSPELESAQLLTWSNLDPIVSCNRGVLIGEIERDGDRENRVIVISDPDLFNNHGLGRGDNASIFLQFLRDEVLTRVTEIVIDEHIHGYGTEFSVWRELFRPPLLFLTLQLLMTLGAGVWLGMGRFGAPVPARENLDAGKTMLIANTARLLRHGHHSAHSLRRYLQAAKREVAARLHAPPELGVDELTPWLTRVGRHHEIETDLEALESRVRSATIRERGGELRVLSAARRVHRWKEELLNAAAGHPGRR